MKKISLGNKRYALVDDEDYSYLSRFNWVLGSTGHVFRNMHCSKCHTTTSLFMVQLIVTTPSWAKVNYKDRNPLNLQKDNIIFAPFGMASHRNSKIKDCSSIYKGVTKRPGGWSARIIKDKVTYNLGIFNTEEKAAEAYNEKAVELYGEEAYQNVIHLKNT